MPRIDPELQRLKEVRTFTSLIKYLKDELNWPIPAGEADDVSFDYDPAELGFNSDATAKIDEVKQLRPLDSNQKWGIFWVKFGKKKLPVQMLRRALGNLVIKKRASTKKGDLGDWKMHDLLFISAYGDDTNRHITFAHFSESEDSEKSLPVLKVLGWDDDDTILHLQDTYKTLVSSLNWDNTPVDDLDAWREHWASAFKVGHREVINTTKELVVELAHLATVIKKSVLTSINAETEKGPWRKLMMAFQDTLIKDLDSDQFADVIAQTISYGLLTARLSSEGPISLKNLVDMVPSTNPFLKDLLKHFLKSSGLKEGKGAEKSIGFNVDEAGINDVVELLNRANAQAIRNDFGKKTDGEDPVIHFYEHFLEVLDKETKDKRGVFYTPQSVVSYIVRSVHELLQNKFGLVDGLADTSTWAEVKERHKELRIPEGIKPDIDPFVQILDPATGTATFLIEVIEVIHSTMVAKWDKDRVPKAEQPKKWNTYVPTHLLPRLYAYELMMAPYAIAHMKVGLKLTETGFTAWDKITPDIRANIFLTNALEPWVKQPQLVGFDALAREAAAVNEAKRRTHFTVIIGNPPYSGHSSNNNVVTIVDKVHDYIEGIPELKKPGQAKWLQDDYVKFIRYSESEICSAEVGILGFVTNHSFIDNPTFRGMRRSLSTSFESLCILDLHGNSTKRECSPDGSADDNVFQIKQGVCITLAVRLNIHDQKTYHSDLFGTKKHKYDFLRNNTQASTRWSPVSVKPDFFIFRPQDDNLSEEYLEFYPLTKAMGENGDPAPGIVTTQDEFAISWSRNEAIKKVEALLATKTEPEARELFSLCGQSQWSYKNTKSELPKMKWREQAGEILYRPFDSRWTIFNAHVAVHRRLRATRHLLDGSNIGLCVGKAGQVVGSGEWNLISCTRHPVDFNFFYRGGACIFPLKLIPEEDCGLLNDVRLNLDLRFVRALSKSCTTGSSETSAEATSIISYIYSILHSPKYRLRYADFLKLDFPRIPLIKSSKLFQKLARLGQNLTSLHLLESEDLDSVFTELIGSHNPMVEKISWSKNTVWLNKSQTVGIKGVKEDVWNFHVGGYQVCQKWLKDRKGRKLTKDDIEHYQKIVGALSETIRLMAEIDKVIDEHGGWPGAFQAAK